MEIGALFFCRLPEEGLRLFGVQFGVTHMSRRLGLGGSDTRRRPLTILTTLKGLLTESRILIPYNPISGPCNSTYNSGGQLNPKP